MLTESSLLRLETQLDCIPLLLKGYDSEAISARPVPAKWSANENLAHLARHHEIFLQRLRRITDEDAPKLGRYSAEEDPEWPRWSLLSTGEVLTRLESLRREIIKLVRGLSEGKTDRVGIHPLFGEMNLALWLEFFLLHEAHHLYVVMTRLGQTKKRLADAPE